MSFTFKKLALPGLVLIEPRIFTDDRGYFFEAYKQSLFTANGIKDDFIQDNSSFSTQGVLRGLHYQLPPHAQAKLVRCLNGRIFDVAVDIRRSSPTFGQWLGLELSADEKNMLYIPAGFAHGFYTITGQAEILYKVSAEYAPQAERGIIWNDPDIRIDWPVKAPLLSAKDRRFPLMNQADLFD